MVRCERIQIFQPRGLLASTLLISTVQGVTVSCNHYYDIYMSSYVFLYTLWQHCANNICPAETAIMTYISIVN